MSIFKRYKSLDDILKIKDEALMIEELYKFLDKKCHYGDSLETLNDKEKDLYLILSFYNEMAEGGFEQYFSNIYGQYVDETIVALDHIDMSSISQIINHTTALFPNKAVLKNDYDKKNILELLLLDDPQLFNQFDEQYYELHEGLKSCIIQLVHDI